jgi:hypothetical protein
MSYRPQICFVGDQYPDIMAGAFLNGVEQGPPALFIQA